MLHYLRISKVFDCLPRNLIIAKLAAYRFDRQVSELKSIIPIAFGTSSNMGCQVWFHENGLKANQDKYHFLSSLDINTKFSLPACILENADSQKLLGVTIDRKLNFNEHVTNLCDNVSRKIQGFTRIFPDIPQTQKQLLMNAYFVSIWLLFFSLDEPQ